MIPLFSRSGFQLWFISGLFRFSSSLSFFYWFQDFIYINNLFIWLSIHWLPQGLSYLARVFFPLFMDFRLLFYSLSTVKCSSVVWLRHSCISCMSEGQRLLYSVLLSYWDFVPHFFCLLVCTLMRFRFFNIIIFGDYFCYHMRAIISPTSYCVGCLFTYIVLFASVIFLEVCLSCHFIY